MVTSAVVITNIYCIGNYNIMHVCRQLLFTYWDESEKDISYTQTFLLAASTALSLHDEGVDEDSSLSSVKCRALIKRAISYTIFKPPHKKNLQPHVICGQVTYCQGAKACS